MNIRGFATLQRLTSNYIVRTDAMVEIADIITKVEFVILHWGSKETTRNTYVS